MSRIAHLNLHEIANSGGFGSGRQALMAAGAWDERRGLKPRDYRVIAEYSLKAAVTVTARTQDEAIERATDLLADGHGSEVSIIAAEANCIERKYS